MLLTRRWLWIRLSQLPKRRATFCWLHRPQSQATHTIARTVGVAGKWCRIQLPVYHEDGKDVATSKTLDGPVIHAALCWNDRKPKLYVCVFLSKFSASSTHTKPAWNRYQRSRRILTSYYASTTSFILIFTEKPSKSISAHTFSYFCLAPWHQRKRKNTHMEYGFHVVKMRWHNRDRGATLRFGGGEAPLVPQYWGGGTRHFFLLTLYNLKNIEGTCAPRPPSPPCTLGSLHA